MPEKQPVLFKPPLKPNVGKYLPLVVLDMRRFWVHKDKHDSKLKAVLFNFDLKNGYMYGSDHLIYVYAYVSI